MSARSGLQYFCSQCAGRNDDLPQRQGVLCHNMRVSV